MGGAAMKEAFDQVCDRRGTGSIKWDFGPESTHEDPLPLWIADMDFSTPECVINGIQNRLKHPVFGYFSPDSRFYDSIINWHEMRFGVKGLLPEQIQYQHSVLGSIATAIEITTEEGDGILVQTPGYTKFKEIIDQHHRKLVENPLIYDGETYVIDYEDMEEKIRTHKIKTAIFCSPNNPTGRVWERSELTRFVELCQKYQVTIIADEIWADFARKRPHTPLHVAAGDYRDHVISFYAPTKTFNLAGLVISYAVIFDPELAARFQDYADATHYNNCNALAVEALIAAYEQGGSWVDELNTYIGENVDYVYDFLQKNLPQIRTVRSEGTYLMWLDFTGTGLDADTLKQKCLHEAGLVLNDGRTCIGNGVGCMRLNVATARARLKEAMRRLLQVFGPLS